MKKTTLKEKNKELKAEIRRLEDVIISDSFTEVELEKFRINTTREIIKAHCSFAEFTGGVTHIVTIEEGKIVKIKS